MVIPVRRVASGGSLRRLGVALGRMLDALLARFEGCVAGHVGHQVHAGCFELVADHPQPQQEDAQVVFGAFGIELALATGGGAGGDGLGGQREHKLDVGFDFARMERRVGSAHLDRVAIPEIVQVERGVAGRVVMLRSGVLASIPCAVEVAQRARTALLDSPNEVVAQAAAVALAVGVDAEGVKDQFLLLVEGLGEVEQLLRIEDGPSTWMWMPQRLSTLQPARRAARMTSCSWGMSS
jgi:hypothetical protein